jgi:hypothetical protein
MSQTMSFSEWRLNTGFDSHSWNVDPLFVDADGADNVAGNEDDDFHLKSTGGSWRSGGAFAADAVNSPGLDAGDPSGWGLERGRRARAGRINSRDMARSTVRR